MSGIVGLLHLDGSPIDPSLLRRLTDFLSFRGPDGQEVWSEGPVGLGHALLRTSRRGSPQRHPCHAGEAWIAADARIDARRELAAGLEAAGRPDVGQACDGEVILHAYQAWGDTCLARLLGDFSFAIWDAARQRLFCARDHFGVRPFYYARAGNTVIVSNTLECIRQHPGVPGRLKEQAVGDFLAFGFNQAAETTTFADIQSLPPGHCLVCEDGQVRTRRYWTLPREKVRFARAEEYQGRFREVLDAAVADCLAVPSPAVLMSGGLDSPSLAAAARKQLSFDALPPVRAYTVVYDSLIPHEERRWAGLVARHLDLPIDYVPADDYQLFERWDDPSLHTPEPQGNPLWALPVDVARRANAGGHRVVLTGEAGDAVSAPSHTLPDLLATGHAWPLARDIFSYRRAHGRRPPFGTGAWWRRQAAGARREAGEPSGPDIPRWLNGRVAGNIRQRAADGALGGGGGWAYQELQSPMWPWCALVQDAGWTRVPVEVRYPFLDLRLVSFMLSVPSVPWAHDKELMRTAMRGRLPEDVLRRPKAPLARDPVAELFQRQRPPLPPPNSQVWELVDRATFEEEWSAGARPRELLRVISLAKWMEQQDAVLRRSFRSR